MTVSVSASNLMSEGKRGGYPCDREGEGEEEAETLA
jgi:hypothetical protein